MMSLSKERKERRLQSYDGMMMTRRGYNAALCGLLLYGIAAAMRRTVCISAKKHKKLNA